MILHTGVNIFLKNHLVRFFQFTPVCTNMLSTLFLFLCIVEFWYTSCSSVLLPSFLFSVYTIFVYSRVLYTSYSAVLLPSFLFSVYTIFVFLPSFPFVCVYHYSPLPLPPSQQNSPET